VQHARSCAHIYVAAAWPVDQPRLKGWTRHYFHPHTYVRARFLTALACNRRPPPRGPPLGRAQSRWAGMRAHQKKRCIASGAPREDWCLMCSGTARKNARGHVNVSCVHPGLTGPRQASTERPPLMAPPQTPVHACMCPTSPLRVYGVRAHSLGPCPSPGNTP
jgi:hypothetical protein